MDRRVVVTGVGVINSLGFCIDTFWKQILAGKSGITKSVINPADYPDQCIPPVAGQIDMAAFMQLAQGQNKLGINPHIFSKVDFFTLYGVAALRQAVEEANCTAEVLKNAGVIAGNIFGGVRTAEKAVNSLRSNKEVRPSTIPALTSSALQGQSSLVHGTLGGGGTVNDACAAAAFAVTVAWAFIKQGILDIVLVPCADSYLTAAYMAAFGNMKYACSKKVCDPDRASRPFDMDRDGFILAEGGAGLVMETLDHAIARGVTQFPYGEIVSCATGSEAFSMIEPDVAGEARCMRKALAFSGLTIDDIDVIKTHATSTIPGDIAEAEAIQEVFGKRRKKVAVIAPKERLGHLMGAAGLTELIIALLSMRDSILPPMMNLQNLDPRCNKKVIDFVTGTPREANVRAVLCNSFGFGGADVSIIIKKI